MSVAVITGGAGGLGRALTMRLLQEHWTVVVLDLPGASLDAMSGPQVAVVACDLTDPTQVQAACTTITDRHPSIDLVIYAAGITHIGAFEDASMDAHRRVFEVNYFGAVMVARGLLGSVRRARGVHLAVSSVAGFAPLHHRTAYAASKHALQGFFASLRSEEKPHGVACLIAAPSFVATNPDAPGRSADGTARPGSASDGIDTMTPDDAAKVILAGARSRRPMSPVGRIAAVSWWLMRIAPSLYQRLMERKIKGA
ncbi:MAG: SDR family NAD(P)-dependent oxidoreductase [Gemmobacter sp.]|nr:SDR family NAD(P)-dependent oxidoreductase [Gemmobacter sp.]